MASSVVLGYPADYIKNEATEIDATSTYVGGDVIWLSQSGPQSGDLLRCKWCKLPLALLLHAFAPVLEIEGASARGLSVFMCSSSDCKSPEGGRGWRVLRTQCQDPNYQPEVSKKDVKEEVLEKDDPKSDDQWGSTNGNDGGDDAWGAPGGDDWGTGGGDGGFGGSFGDEDDIDVNGLLKLRDESLQEKVAGADTKSSRRMNQATTEAGFISIPFLRHTSTGNATSTVASTSNDERKSATPGATAIASTSFVPFHISVDYEPAGAVTTTKHSKKGRGDVGADCDREVKGWEGEQYESLNADDKFLFKYQARMAFCPEQVLRYAYNGDPLWMTGSQRPSSIPRCASCNAERTFEFQILPTLLNVLDGKKAKRKTDPEIDVNRLSFGNVMVYTCSRSCEAGSSHPVEEFLFVEEQE